MQSDTAALGRIQNAVRYGRLFFSRHALDEMDSASATELDVECAIKTATAATLSPDGPGRFVLHGGTDLRGLPLKVVAKEIQPGLYIITVW